MWNQANLTHHTIQTTASYRLGEHTLEQLQSDVDAYIDGALEKLKSELNAFFPSVKVEIK
jgi:hypothetical protein